MRSSSMSNQGGDGAGLHVPLHARPVDAEVDGAALAVLQAEQVFQRHGRLRAVRMFVMSAPSSTAMKLLMCGFTSRMSEEQ